jgi:hypothetical protein
MTEMTGGRALVLNNPPQGLGAGEEQALDEALKTSPDIELGLSGLKRYGGIVDEEFLPQLRGSLKAIQIYREMSDNDPIIGSALFAINNLIRNVDWRVEPSGKDKESADAAKFVEECMEDMASPWGDFIMEVLSCLPYGFAWHEIVYKKRDGLYAKDGAHRSKFTDGKIGWRKMPLRSQDTWLRWIFEDNGDVKAFVQLAPPTFKTTYIPIEKSLLFRYKTFKGNPEGVSMLRQAYRPWFMKKRIEEFEAIGVERDLAGLPVIKVPAKYLKAKSGTDEYKAVQGFTKMAKSLRRGESEGVVFPLEFDQDSKQPMFSIELLGSPGGRQFNTNEIIQRYEERILQTMLADWLLVGHDGGTGSYSMHVDKTGIFRTALNSITQMIADVLNRHAIPRLFELNGWRPESLPKIVPSDVDAPDITQLSQFMSQMAGIGLNWFPDADLENMLRKAARLPVLDEDEMERRRMLQQKAESTQFAQANLEYVDSRLQLAQALGAGMPSDQAAQAVQSGRQQDMQQEQGQISAQQQEQSAQAGHQRQLESAEHSSKLAISSGKDKKPAGGGKSGGSSKT